MNEKHAKQNRTIEELNQDLSLKDAKIIWTGRTVSLWDKREQLAVFAADYQPARLQERITRWLDKNNMRCTQIHDGKIWL